MFVSCLALWTRHGHLGAVFSGGCCVLLVPLRSLFLDRCCLFWVIRSATEFPKSLCERLLSRGPFLVVKLFYWYFTRFMRLQVLPSAPHSGSRRELLTCQREAIVRWGMSSFVC